MTEPAPTSAGALLRAARERRGIHIGALAATLKVSPRKIESLEADRHDELPDPAFTRSLAMSVCRHVGTDPAPVLALLPQASVAPLGLEHVTTGLRAPFDGRHPDDRAMRAWPPRHPLLTGAAVLLLVAAASLWFLMADRPVASAVPEAAIVAEPAASVASAVQGAASSVSGAASEPLPGASAAASDPAGAWSPAAAAVAPVAAASAPAAPGGAFPSLPESSITVTATSWVEVRDGRGQVRWSRLLAAGESVPLEGPVPMRIVIGNARAAKVVFAGRVVDLAPWTRDNVSRLELQ